MTDNKTIRDAARTHARYKLLVMDVDGTLVNKAGAISPEDRLALDQAKQSGVEISLATGRPPKSTRRIIDDLLLTGCHIFFEGALLADLQTKETVHSKPIEPSMVKDMVSFAHAHGIYLELYSSFGYFAERETWWTRASRDSFDIEPEIRDLIGIWEDESVMKGQLVCSNNLEREQCDSFCRYFSDSATVVEFHRVTTPMYPKAEFINVSAAGVSKGTALRALATHKGVPLDRVAAIGDWTNDIPMISAAGLGIAMGNAHNDVKEAADVVTEDVEEDGLAVAIRRFIL